MLLILFLTKNYWRPTEPLSSFSNNSQVRSVTKITVIPNKDKIEFTSPTQKKFIRKQYNINEYYAELKVVGLLSEEDWLKHEEDLDSLINSIYSHSSINDSHKLKEPYRLWLRQKNLYYKKIKSSISSDSKAELSSTKLFLEDIHNVKIKFLNVHIDSLLNSY
jgi:hypothetical protein